MNWQFRADTGLINPSFVFPSEGDPVRRWTNLGGGDTWFQCVITNQQPIYHATGAGGQPYVQWDGIDDYLERTGMNTLPSPDSEYFAVVDVLNTTPTRVLFAFNEHFRLLIATPNSSPPQLGYYDGISYKSIAPATTGLQLLRFRFEGAAARGTVWRSNVLLDRAYAKVQPTIDMWGLGRAASGTAGPAAIKLYEIRRYLNLNSTTAAAAITEELRARYAIW